MKKVTLDAGHGGKDSGAVGNGLKEKDLTLEIAKQTKSYLESNYSGVSVQLTRSTDKFIELPERAAIANKNKSDLFVSIHINSASGTNGTGFETFTYNKLSAKSKTKSDQKVLHASILNEIASFGVSNRKEKADNLSVLRNTTMSAILTESLFINNPADAKLLKDKSFIKAVSVGHAKGIAKVLGLKAKKTPESPSKAPSQPSEPKGDTYKVQKGDTLYGIARQHGMNVDDLKKLNGLKSDIIRVGQTLKVKQTSVTYKVKKGDTLYGIAKQHGTTVANIKKLNGLKSDLINIGDVLRVK
ncbi:N-acetylmuramoyl-L-alanine amidase [Bacillus phage Novomoskovsk]|uniref:N-acetylmuramoyl-L-alanine amidase n=1 Tax=Bacillus phage Novomoskovsk TaxID=2736258 RepID=A0A6M9Z701_9CAUD|nr:N-acetylmuramoyl-L-alanine amidase [Bacillus phage Novomoskovsk]